MSAGFPFWRVRATHLDPDPAQIYGLFWPAVHTEQAAHDLLAGLASTLDTVWADRWEIVRFDAAGAE